MSSEVRVVERIRWLVAEAQRGAGNGAVPSDDTPLEGAGVGLHSLEMVALLIRIEQEFGIAVEDGEVSRDRLTVQQLCHLVLGKLDRPLPADGSR